MATNYSDYDYKSDANAVLNAKIGWNLATTDEDRQKQNKIANAARDRLKAYGYEDLADQISASGANATQTRQIIENYSKPKTTAPVETNNLKSNEVNRENAGLFDKYNESYDYLTKTNPFTTDEAKAILAKYDLAGLQGRDNAVASGGASNGGNIDSYAAANAMRQQAALVNQGQMTVLDAHQKKIDNVRGLLSDMGVNIDRVFNQDETAKNNNVARLSEQASVTGYTPSEWVIKNDDVYNTYLNEDGTFKKEMEGVDIQALINSAKASGDTETANKLAVVRARKILSNYGEFGKYVNEGDISYMKPQQTEAGRQFDEQNKATREALGIESADKRYEIDKKAELTQKEIDASLEATRLENERNAYAGYNVLLSMWPVNETEKRTFIEEHIKPLYESGKGIPEESLKQLIITNSAKYNIDVDDATKICQAYGISTDWLNDYRDRTNADGGVTWYDKSEHEGQYGGMVKK